MKRKKAEHAIAAQGKTGRLGGRLNDISVRQVPAPEVRFTSGKTIYVEALVGGRWVGRYWAADGRINIPYELWDSDAFELQIDGQALSTGWAWVSAFEEPPPRNGQRHLTVELESSLRPVRVRVHTILDGTPVLARWLEILNTAGRPAALSLVYPWSGLLWHVPGLGARGVDDEAFPGRREAVFSLGYFGSFNHSWEGWLEWIPLRSLTTRLEDRRGQGYNHPFFLLRNEIRGEYFIGHLAWSGNWNIEFQCEQDPGGNEASLAFRAGPAATAPQRVIAPGETVRTPAVHMGHVEGDLDAAVQAMHDHIRRSVLPLRKPERSYLVQYSVPGDTGYMAERVGDSRGMNEAKLVQHVDIAAAVGAELFITDAGWWDIPGDWTPSPSRFPRGLEPIVEYVHSKGMLFGLYLEIERVISWQTGDLGAKESAVGREHPDWIGPKGILDLTRPEVAAYAESELSRIIEQYRLDLWRLDYNPFFTFDGTRTQRDGYLESNYWRYYEAFYGLCERIRARYPDLILQQCAAGGARNDLGTVGQFHEAYLTDGLSMPHVLRVYAGATMALPPEILIAGLGIPPIPKATGHFDTHLRATFTLSTPWILGGVAPSLDALAPDRRERYLRYARMYKQFIRPLLPTVKMYHHAPATATQGVESGGWFVQEFAAPDRRRGWATLVRIARCDSDTFVLRPRGLAPGQSYRVTFDSTGETATIAGWELMRDGIPVRLESLLSSELLLFRAGRASQ